MKQTIACYLLYLTITGLGSAYAQETGAWGDSFKLGVSAIQEGTPEEALDPLEAIFESSPAAYNQEHLSVAYWLGLAYLQEGYPDDAREVWNIGLRALDEAGLFDPRLAITFVRTTFEKGWPEDRAFASAVYLHLIGSLPVYLPSDAERQIAPFLYAISFVMPTSHQRTLGLDKEEDFNPDAITPSQASQLVTWWHSRDLAPATRNNEMLEEHLERVTHALRTYYIDGTFDDRGIVYIRLGQPSRTTSIQFDNSGFRNKVLDRNLTINESDFPDNEFWFYEHIDDTAQYLFHNTTGTFRVGEITDLLPNSIRSGLGSSERGQKKARATVRTLEEIYRQLSLYHQDYATRYQDVVTFTSLLDESEIAASTASAFQRQDDEVESEGDQNMRDLLANNRGPDFSSVGLPGSSFNPNRPDLFVQSALVSEKALSETLIANRDEYVPSHRSNTFDEVAPLPLYVRSARFLENDGSTRTEIYWAAPSGSLELEKQDVERIELDGFEAKDYLLVTSTVQKTARYRDRVVNLQRTLLPDVGRGEDTAIKTQTLVIEGDTGRYHIAIQWDQYAAALTPHGKMQSAGPLLKTHVYRRDSLDALSQDPSQLEISDIQPMLLPEGVSQEEAAARINELEGIIYPSPFIRSEVPLLLYFEVYHLNFGSDDQTSYTLAYEIERSKRRGLLGRRKGESTSFSSSQNGKDRNTSERLLLDLRDMQGAGTIEIRIEVTDEISGQKVERLISFEVE